MADILGIIFPIYAIIALGYLLVRFAILQKSDLGILGSLVLNVTLPALLFGAIARQDLRETLSLPYLTIYAVAGLAVIALSYLILTATGTTGGRRALSVMGASCPNSGFVGYPVMVLAYPDIAASVLAQNMIVELLLFIPIGLALIDYAQTGRTANPFQQIHLAIVGLIRRPLVIAIGLGLAVSASGLNLPRPVWHLIEIVAGPSVALSLIVIGGGLVGVSLAGMHRPALTVSGLKLILHPLLAAGTAVIVLAVTGWAMKEELRTAVILSAAMPMLSIFGVFARGTGEEGTAAVSLLYATALAFGTLSLLLGIL